LPKALIQFCGALGPVSPTNSARSAAPAKAKTGAGGDDFEDFPGALADEDDDLPF